MAPGHRYPQAALFSWSSRQKTFTTRYGGGPSSSGCPRPFAHPSQAHRSHCSQREAVGCQNERCQLGFIDTLGRDLHHAVCFILCRVDPNGSNITERCHDYEVGANTLQFIKKVSLTNYNISIEQHEGNMP